MTTGLYNVGNTCYLNSCLQVLANMPELELAASRFRSSTAAAPAPTARIANAFFDLCNQMRHTDKQTRVIPTSFVKELYAHAATNRATVFVAFNQNDVGEFLYFLLDCLHEAIKRPVRFIVKDTGASAPENTTHSFARDCYAMLKDTCEREFSEINTIFYGVQMTQVIEAAPTGGQVKKLLANKPEYFMALNLDLPVVSQGRTGSSVTVFDCLQKYVATELLDGDNKWFNDKTREYEVVTKRTMFWSFPPVLVILLKRTLPGVGARKVRTLVQFPLEGLDLRAYAKDYDRAKYIYDLFGVCYHHGHAALSGHYTAAVKPFGSTTWLHYNDSVVTVVANPLQHICTPDAYCLFYRLRRSS